MCEVLSKWSEISYNGVYAHSDESRQAVLGYFLVSLGIDLEKLPHNLFVPYSYFPPSVKKTKEYTLKKVYVRDIVGTSRQEYAEDNQVLLSFMKLKRIKDYILNGQVTKNKYLWMMKHMEQECPVILSRNLDNTFYVNEDSKGDVLIQIADFISGTLAYVYDLHKKDSNAPDYLKILASKITYVRFYPKTFEQFIHDPLGMPHEYDETIARLCHKQAAMFLDKHKEDEDEEIKAQCIVLEYLLFRMMNNHYRGYISTKELKNQLEYTGVQHMPWAKYLKEVEQQQHLMELKIYRKNISHNILHPF